MQELNKGLISIIMLCYSSTRKCMKSKRSQTYKNIKLLFINNSSYEKTKGVLKELASQINFNYTR
jgi:GT2 family glycosyltransferase